MNLKNKKNLASKVLAVGKERIYLNPENLKQISEAITRQDIIDLKNNGSIVVKDIKGRKKVERRKNKRGVGKIKKRKNETKKKYVLLTRKLRTHLKNMKKRGQINLEKYRDIRKKIRASKFKSKRHFVESEKGI